MMHRTVTDLQCELNEAMMDYIELDSHNGFFGQIRPEDETEMLEAMASRHGAHPAVFLWHNPTEAKLVIRARMRELNSQIRRMHNLPTG